MAGKTLDLRDVVSEDTLGVSIARKWIEWHMLRQNKINDWQELRKYVYATDTTQTANSKLPWKNKTTIPKLCQIRDNLYANYLASLFPKRKWLKWEAAEKDANSVDKRNSIINYMSWVIGQDSFKKEIGKLVLDYIDYGNAFVMPDWMDRTVQMDDGREQVGYVGPTVRRVSPIDIVFNPIASTFEDSPKIIRSLVSIGEVKELLNRLSTNETKDDYEKIFNYLYELRSTTRAFTGDLREKDEYYRIDGFTSFQQYLQSDYVELLTFYGDLYDYENNELLKNHVIIIADRHKIISKRPNDSLFGIPAIFHVGWRKRQDNLWAMGPLDNLVGMQYRLDHIENLKADVFDLITFPPLKIKGYVDKFTWGPFEQIICGDDGDVEILAPPWNVLQANQEIQSLQMQMEEMAGSPKEAMGFRTPGEKTAFEVQRLENAASRIFQNKIAQFEEQVLEPLLNAMLELARRKITAAKSIPVFNDEFNSTTFMSLTASDITGTGVIRPIAARHFAERSEIVQNLNAFFASPLGQDPGIRAHFSGIGLARLHEDLLELKDYQIVQPYVRLTEEADAQRIAQVNQEKVQMEAQTPSGFTPDDHSASVAPVPNPAAEMQQMEAEAKK